MNTRRQYPAGPGAGAEALEPRRLMSAVVENGVLVVTGTPFNDTIFVWKNTGPLAGYRVHIIKTMKPNEDFVIPYAGVHSVTFRGLGGDDHLNAQWAPESPGDYWLDLPTRLEGGSGNDRLYGGAGAARSSIFGGFGNDSIYGGIQADWIDGGWGNDVIRGNGGNDIIFGRYGDDILYGNDGDDRLYGGPGNDELGYYDKTGGPETHEPGNDLLDGGTGDDRLVGGAGTDRMYGGPGVDWFFYLDTRAEMIDWTPGEPTDYRPPIR